MQDKIGTIFDFSGACRRPSGQRGYGPTGRTLAVPGSWAEWGHVGGLRRRDRGPAGRLLKTGRTGCPFRPHPSRTARPAVAYARRSWGSVAPWPVSRPQGTFSAENQEEASVWFLLILSWYCPTRPLPMQDKIGTIFDFSGACRRPSGQRGYGPTGRTLAVPGSWAEWGHVGGLRRRDRGPAGRLLKTGRTGCPFRPHPSRTARPAVAYARRSWGSVAPWPVSRPQGTFSARG